METESSCIDAVETAEAEGRWQYCTWQVKVNLIYDMRFGGAGIGGFTEERKEDAVIAVLRSARLWEAPLIKVPIHTQR
ncbi:MAG: hypothetical protein GF401_05275 [Chitinivibrionales bacterium]|nr:hypothetical protein [Chitinivibrionales bacterium]